MKPMTRAVSIALMLAIAGCGGSASGPSAPSARTHRISLQVLGDGKGTIRSLPGELQCASGDRAGSDRCTAGFAGGQVLLLRPDPGTGSFFHGWNIGSDDDACAGRSLCWLDVTRDVTITATFEPLAARSKDRVTVRAQGDGEIQAIARDGRTIYIAGVFQGGLELDRMLITAQRSAIFVARYDLRYRRYTWSQAFEVDGFASVMDIAVTEGQIVVGGFAAGTIKLGDATQRLSGGYLLGLRQDGDAITSDWIHPISRENTFSSVNRVLARDGAIIVAGYFVRRLSSGTRTEIADGSGTFAAALAISRDRAGQVQVRDRWLVKLSDSGLGSQLGLAYDKSGVLAAVPFSGSITLGASSYASQGDTDVALVHLEPDSGSASLRAHITGKEQEHVVELAVDADGQAYTLVRSSTPARPGQDSPDSLRVHAHDATGQLVASRDLGQIASVARSYGAMAIRPGRGVWVTSGQSAAGEDAGKLRIVALDRALQPTDDEVVLDSAPHRAVSVTGVVTGDGLEIFAAGAFEGQIGDDRKRSIAGAPATRHPFLYSSIRGWNSSPTTGSLTVTGVVVGEDGDLAMSGVASGLLVADKHGPRGVTATARLAPPGPSGASKEYAFVAMAGAMPKQLSLSALAGKAEISALAGAGDGIVAVGWFEGTLAWGEKTVKSQGKKDGFIAWLRPGGEVTHLVSVGDDSDDELVSVAADASGNVVVAGHRMQQGRTAGFVASHDATGAQRFAPQWLGGEGDVKLARVILDEDASPARVIVAGVASDPADVARSKNRSFVTTLAMDSGAIGPRWEHEPEAGPERIVDMIEGRGGLVLLVERIARESLPRLDGGASPGEASGAVFLRGLPAAPGPGVRIWERAVDGACVRKAMSLFGDGAGAIWVTAALGREMSGRCGRDLVFRIDRLSPKRTVRYSVPLLDTRPGAVLEGIARGPGGHFGMVARIPQAAEPGPGASTFTVSPELTLMRVDKLGSDQAGEERR